MRQQWSWKTVCQPCRRRAVVAKATVCPFSGQSSSDGKCPFATNAAVPSSSSSSAPVKPASTSPKECAPVVAATPTPAKAPPAPRTDAAKVTTTSADAKAATPALAKLAAVAAGPLERHLKRAGELLEQKEHEKAWEEYDRAIALDQQCEEAYLGKVEALRRLKRLPKAYSACRQAQERLPGSAKLQELGEKVRSEYQAGKQEREERFKAELREAEAKVKAAAAGGCPASTAKDSRTEEEVRRQLAQWAGRTPGREERQHLKEALIAAFREQYARLGQAKAKAVTDTATSAYAPDTKTGLEIKGGHRPMPRPANVQLPPDFKKPTGVISFEELASFNCRNPRMLISVFGDIFDVSDRPDKYGQDGPYSYFAGADITWGLVSGKDTVENANRFYDVWKIAPEEYRHGKLQGLCSWRAFYEVEYGAPIGRLDVYEREAELPPPPMEEAEGCSVM